jgi:hypothetical protein
MVTTPDPALPVLVLTVPLYLTLVFTGADDLETLNVTLVASLVNANVLTTGVVALRAMSWAQYSIVWVPVPVTTTLLLTLPSGAGVPVGVGVGVGVGVMRAWQLTHAPRSACGGG